MKKLYFILFAFLLSSCGAQRLIERADRIQKRAIEKGAIVTEKIDTLIVNDTITETTHSNDTTFITSYIDRYITKEAAIRYVTRIDKRRENRMEKRMYKDSVSNVDQRYEDSIKIVKLETRWNGRTEKAAAKGKRSLWWLWILIGSATTIAIRFLISRYLPSLKK